MTNDRTSVFRFVDRRDPDECWPWRGGFGGRARDRRPYYQYNNRRTIAYRIVYELVHGIELAKTQLLLHSCDNGGWPIGCCNPSHLRIGNERDNAGDMMDRERHGLPASVIKAIRRLLSKQTPQQTIAEIYGVSRETISAIATGRTYRHIKEDQGDGGEDLLPKEPE